MSRAKRIYRTIQSSDGRVKLATLSSIGVLAAALVLFLGVFPANAGAGQASNEGVQPTELDYGGGSGGCAFITSPYTEYHINNPATGTYSLPGGGTVTLVVTGNDTLFSYTFSDNLAAFQLTVNGGQKSLEYDNAASDAGPRSADGGVHAPTKGNSPTNLFKLSHINFCFDELPEAPISGTVFYDDNVDTINNDGMPASGLSVYVIDADGTVVNQGTTSANGEYSILVPVGADYLVCLGTTAEELVQTTPIENPPNCADAVEGLSLFDSGFDVASLGEEGSDGNDFGVIEEFCGEILIDSGGVFEVARFEIFEGGNNEVPCDAKSGAVFVSGGEVGFPVVGPSSGAFAAFGEITKTFPNPTTVTPLVYKQGPGDSIPSSTGGFEEIPWCGLRTKMGSDGIQFDTYVGTPGTYPSLAGIVDPVSGDSAVACLVFKEESLVQPAPGDTDVKQLNILLVQDDPQFR